MKPVFPRQGDASEASRVYQLQKSSFCAAHGPVNNCTPHPCSSEEPIGPSRQKGMNAEEGVLGRRGGLRGSGGIRRIQGVNVIKIIIGLYEVPEEYFFFFLNLENRKPVTRHQQGIVPGLLTPPPPFSSLASSWMFLELLVQNGHPFPVTPYRLMCL